MILGLEIYFNVPFNYFSQVIMPESDGWPVAGGSGLLLLIGRVVGCSDRCKFQRKQGAGVHSNDVDGLM